MKAMVMTRFGSPEVFVEQELPMPQPQARDLLVRVHATSVNPMDCEMRAGNAPWTGVQPPAILGFDVSGEIAAVGSEIADFQVGDLVYYTPTPFSAGSNAEYNVVPANIVARKPATLSHLEAAALPLVGTTAWEAVVNRAALKRGETILIHGGAGGVGSLAIQIARALGATVIATCRERNREFVLSLGAVEAIDYSQTDVAEAANHFTENAGVDVVLGALSGDMLATSLRVVKPFGRLVSMSQLTGDLTSGFYKNVTIHFSSCRRERATLDSLRHLVEDGQVKPAIDGVLPLRSLAEAHQRLEDGGLRGKIVVQVLDE